MASDEARTATIGAMDKDDRDIHSAKALYERNRARERAKREQAQPRSVENLIVHLTADNVEISSEISVPALREIALSIEPALQDDLDHLIAQLKELSDDYLRAVGSDPEKVCVELGVILGSVKPKTASALVDGILVDRRRKHDSASKWWFLGIGAIVTFIGKVIYDAFVTAGG